MGEGDSGPTIGRRGRVSARTLVDRGLATARNWSAAVAGSTVDCAAIRRWAPPRERGRAAEFAPVVLVHGFAGTDSTWSPLRDALTEAGFDHVITLRYNTFRAGIDDVADWLVLHARRTMMCGGAGAVHLIGHSLGGLVVRHAVQNRGLGGKARTAVMMSSPQSGTWAARLMPTPASRQMRPGSPFLGGLSRQQPDPRTSWLAMHGDADRVVSRSSAMFAPGTPGVRNLRHADAGHSSIARDPAAISAVVLHMLDAELSRRPTAGRPAARLAAVAQPA